MPSESLDPKPPFYGKDGRVKDQRIAQAMAKTEDVARRSESRGIRLVGSEEGDGKTPEEAAEQSGKDFYLKNGIRILPSKVPANVMRIFKRVAAMDSQPSDNPYIEFRKADHEGTSTYVMLFGFTKMNGAWACHRAACTPEGTLIGHVTAETFT